MGHAEKCPVCNGSGRVKNSDLYSTGPSEITCHGCCGVGWIVIPDQSQYVPPHDKEGD